MTILVKEKQIKIRGYGWHVLTVICCLGMAATLLGICSTADSVFYLPLAERLGTGRGNISFYSTVAGITLAVATPLVVRLRSRLPLRLLVAAGSLLTGGAALAMAFVRSLWALYLLGALRGVGCACISIPVITTILGKWFVKSRGLVVGITMSASGVAGAILSPVFTALLAQYGYTATRVISAGIILLLTLPESLLFLHENPEEVKRCPYGGQSAQLPEQPQPEEKAVLPLRYVSCCFVLLVLFAICASSTNQLVMHFSGFAVSIGMGTAVGAAMISAAMVGNIASKALLGLLCDRIGPYRAITVMGAFGLAGAWILLGQPQSRLLLMLAALLYGTVFSLFTVGTPQVIRSLYGNRQYADAYAAAYAFSGFVSAFTVSIGGYLYDATGSYSATFLMCVLLLLLCVLALAVLARFKRQRAREEAA